MADGPTKLIAQEDFTAYIHCERFKTHMIKYIFCFINCNEVCDLINIYYYKDIYIYGCVETDYSKMQENYLQTLSFADILKFNNLKL
jgi:hypothetical protein